MSNAFGSPGSNPKWTSSSKDGIGTSCHRSCHTWFTLRHGILTEAYYPAVDCPSTRELQFLFSDGETFCHEEKCDLEHKIDCPEGNALYYRIENRDREGRYLLVKELICDTDASVVLIHGRLEIHDQKLQDKLRVYAFLIPHLKRHGRGNTGWKMLAAENFSTSIASTFMPLAAVRQILSGDQSDMLERATDGKT